MNTRLIIAIVSTTLYEIIIVAIFIWGLPRLGVTIPWWGILLIALAFLAFAIGTFRIGSRVLRMKPLPGFSNMAGMEGKVFRSLNPSGYVKIAGELWEATTEEDHIEAGKDILVVKQQGLKLIVRRKPPEDQAE
jgi:membrane-bound ClpP family serine protease